MIIHATHPSFEHRVVLLVWDEIVLAAPTQFDDFILRHVSFITDYFQLNDIKWQSHERATR